MAERDPLNPQDMLKAIAEYSELMEKVLELEAFIREGVAATQKSVSIGYVTASYRKGRSTFESYEAALKRAGIHEEDLGVFTKHYPEEVKVIPAYFVIDFESAAKELKVTRAEVSQADPIIKVEYNPPKKV